jgi:hypothetical protein
MPAGEPIGILYRTSTSPNKRAMPEISVNFSENQLQAFIVGTEKK